MFKFSSAARRAVLSIACLSIGLHAGGAGAGQQLPDEIDAVGGNSSNSRMFWLNYDASDTGINTAVQLNDDASSYPNLNSFAFFRNTCGDAARSDIVAASTNASQLVLYKGGQGTGTPICSGDCPPRPDGLSTSNQRVISVATTGAAGSTPTVWLFKPGECDANEQPAFTRSGSEPFSASGVSRIRAIADTEFVLADAGDALKAGDLLVLVSNPPLIAHLPKAKVDQGETHGATVLLGSSHFGRATPTGLAVVPGEGSNLLVTLSSGEVRHVYFADGAWDSRPLEGSAGMFPNPRGIAAGARGAETYIIVSDQNQGRYIRAVLDIGSDDPMKIAVSKSPGAIRSIVSPVGAPQGVAINQNDPNVSFASECFKPGTDVFTGCQIAGGLAELHFQQGFDGDLDPDARVRVELTFIPDPRDDSARDESGRLKLPYDGQDFFVPATCRGFDTSKADASFGFGGVPRLALIDIKLEPVTFFVTAGNFAQVTERISEILNVGECTDTGARVYYHPSKDLAGDPLPGGTLFDTTVSCQNPSRSISEMQSPFVVCVDPTYVARQFGPDPTFGRNEFVNTNIRRYLDDLKDAVDQLGTDFPELRQELNTLLTGFSNPDMSPGKVPEYYIETSLNADKGALKVLAMNRLEGGNIFKTTEGLPRDLYARLLRGFLGLAFYTKETGALEKYYPPAEFCEPYYEYEGGPFPELPDVQCAE